MTPTRLRAAQFVYDDKLTDFEIAKKVRISVRTLEYWKKRPEFKARLAEIRVEYQQSISQRSIFDKAKRMESMARDWEATETIIEERGRDPDMQDVPGGKTGRLTRNLKMIGTGKEAETVEVYEYDTGLERRRDALRKEAKQEMGEDVKKHELTGKDGGPLAMSIFELARLAALDEDE